MPGTRDTVLNVTLTGLAGYDTLIERLRTVAATATEASNAVRGINLARGAGAADREAAQQRRYNLRAEDLQRRYDIRLAAQQQLENEREVRRQARREARQEETRVDRDRTTRRRMLGGFIGGTLHSVVGEAESRIGAYYATMGPLAGGLTSGSLYGAASASIQARAARQMAIGGPQLAWAGAGAVGAGLTTAGGMAIGGAMLAGGAANFWNPAGWGMIAAGVILGVAAKWGTAAANAQIARMSATQQSAMQVFQQMVEARTGLTKTGLALGAMGLGMPGEGEFHTAAYNLGIESSEAAQKYQAFAAAGGTKTSMMGVLSMERAYGVDASTMGRWQRGFQPGGGASIPGGFSVLSTEILLRNTMSAGMEAGIQRARLGEYLQRIAGLNEQMAERGITISAEGVVNWQRGMAEAGLKGMQGTAGLAAAQNYGGGLAQQLTGMFMPQQAVQALAMRGLAMKGGATPHGMLGALESIMGSPGGMMGFAQEMGGGLPEEYQNLLMGSVTGFGGWGAMGAARKAKPSGASFLTTMFGGAQERAEAIFAGTEGSQLLSTQAISENIITFGTSISTINGYLREMITVSNEAVRNLGSLSGAFKGLLEEMGAYQLDRVPGSREEAMGLVTSPVMPYSAPRD